MNPKNNKSKNQLSIFNLDNSKNFKNKKLEIRKTRKIKRRPGKLRREIRKIIFSLQEEINFHRKKYFEDDTPTIEDAQYDQLLRKLKELEKKFPFFKKTDSVSQTVGGRAMFSPVSHPEPMLSLDNAFDWEEWLKFESKVRTFLKHEDELKYHIMPKFDGLALELYYKNGSLNQASTRGDGLIGEDVTKNALKIADIPKKLITNQAPDEAYIRGEVYLEKESFQRLNEKRLNDNLAAFVSPRNAAAGSLRNSNLEDEGHFLRFFSYGLLNTAQWNLKTYDEALQMLKKWGFLIAKTDLTTVVSNLKEAWQIFETLGEKREKLPYEIDGVVIMLNQLSLWERLGTTNQAPRYALAGKFKPTTTQSIIIDIEIQVGRTGILTPVALMEPVLVGGATVQKATLHNEDELKRKDVRLGDTVVVQRAGDVIPEIVKVIIEKRTKDSVPFIFPDKCPICQSLALRLQDEAATKCSNPNCPAQIEAYFNYFCSRNVMNINGLGPKIIEQILEKKLAQTPLDLYCISQKQWAALDRMGPKSIQNITNELKNSQNNQWWRFISALGIIGVGERTSQLLAGHFSPKNLYLAEISELSSIESIGLSNAENIFNFFKDKNNLDFYQKFTNPKLGFNPQISKEDNQPLSELSFVLTGTLPNMSRNEIKHLIQSRGGKVLSAVSKKTDYVIVGEKAGSKLKEAKKLNLEILNEQEFLILLEKKEKMHKTLN